MKRMVFALSYTTGLLLTLLTLANGSDAASIDVEPISTIENSSPHILMAQAPLSPAPTETTHPPRPGMKPESSAGNRVDAHVKKLHAELRITPAQEELWKSVVEVMRENDQTMDALHKSRAEQAATMTAVDDVKSYAAIADAHADGLKKFASVFEPLYNSMSDEQKKNADKVFSPSSSRPTKPMKSRAK
ncbi:MAG TPA: Spy/CpxP family protein refolding chaperone [Nitrospiraceae bacterium]|jgi:hypothetical protein|nr:Spy/CpxP family protein refolding chaperone [Nitrospiraceae bacterium]